MTRTFRFCAFALLLLAVLAAGTAMAARPRQEVLAPEPTSAGHVALYYHKLTGQAPDFSIWAQGSDDYIQANDFDKELVLREKASEASRAFQLLTFEDPVVVRTKVKLSSYSRARRGFFIQNFKPDTFYSYHFVDRYYALVPLDLLDYQWVPIESGPALEKISAAVAGAKNDELLLYISITPGFADARAPMKVGGKDYWLLSGKVKHISLHDPRSKKLLWENFGRGEMSENQKQLLDLYK